MKDIKNLAQNTKAWPFKEPLKLAKRVEKEPPAKGLALFETG